MKALTIALAALLLAALSSARPAGANERVSFADGKVSFVPPAGFRPLTKEQIAAKFPRANQPQYVFADDAQAVSVAVTFSASRIAPEQLPEFKQAMEAMLPRMVPGLRWVAREFVTIGGRRWLHLELTSDAVDTDIHNHIYATSFQGRALIFGFNSTVERYPAAKSILARSAQSIRVSD